MVLDEGQKLDCDHGSSVSKTTSPAVYHLTLLLGWNVSQSCCRIREQGLCIGPCPLLCEGSSTPSAWWTCKWWSVLSAATSSTEPAGFKRSDEDGCLLSCSAVWTPLQVSQQEERNSNWNLNRSASILLLDARFWKENWFFCVSSTIMLQCL